MKNEPATTKEELCRIMSDVRTLSDRDFSVEFTANDGKGLRDIVRANHAIKLHVCRLVEEILTHREDLPDPPEEQTVGAMMDLFESIEGDQ